MGLNAELAFLDDFITHTQMTFTARLHITHSLSITTESIIHPSFFTPTPQDGSQSSSCETQQQHLSSPSNHSIISKIATSSSLLTPNIIIIIHNFRPSGASMHNLFNLLHISLPTIRVPHQIKSHATDYSSITLLVQLEKSSLTNVPPSFNRPLVALQSKNISRKSKIT